MNKQVSQKLEVTDLNNFLLQVFQNQTMCNANFQGKQMDITNPSSIPNITLTELTSAPSQYLAKANTVVNGSQTDLTVDSIELSNIQPVASSYYQATLKISFKNNFKSVTPKPLRITQLFNTTPSGPNAADIASCVSPGSVISVIVGNNNSFPPPSSQIQNINCATNATCWVPSSFSGSPNMEVRATSTCTDENGNTQTGTNNSLIGSLNAQGSFQYTGMWDCNAAPKSACSQSYTVGGTSVGSHTWRCL